MKFGDPVVHWVGDTVHYQLERTKESDEEWDRLLPSGGHLVHVQSDDSVSPETFTVTLFHQLKCLDVLRKEYICRTERQSCSETDALAQHCLNYLRQSILCNLDSGLESTRNVQGLVTRGYDTVCKDWTKLYDEAERNNKAYLEHSGLT